MSDNEKDINELIRNFQQQQSKQSGMSSPPMGSGNSPNIPGNPNQDNSFLGNNPILNQTNEGFDRHTGIDNQGANYSDASLPMNNQNINTNAINTSSGPSPVPVENACRECGMIHPPLRQGEKCPNALPKAKTKEGEERVIDVNKYLNTLRTVLLSQISMKNIQDVDKLFKNITVEVTKYMESYKED